MLGLRKPQSFNHLGENGNRDPPTNQQTAALH